MRKLAINLLTACVVYSQAALALSTGSPLQQLKILHFDEARVRVQKSAPSLKEIPVEKYGLILFFSNQCSHCINFAPILKRYAKTHHWQIEAISLNGQSLPEFPNAIFATQAMLDVAYQGKPVTYPALFIANRQTHTLFPVSFGELSMPELARRMDGLANKIRTYEETHP